MIYEEENVTRAAPAQVFLQPIAPPSILGLFGFAVSTMMISTYYLGWYGSLNTPIFLFPFVAFFGGLAQFISCLWAFRGRDGLAVAMHGLWGSFYMGWSLVYLLAAAGLVAMPPLSQELGIWFVGLAWVSWMLTYAATGVNFAFSGVLLFLAAGSTAAAVANFAGSGVILAISGWLLLISSVIAWYTASAYLYEFTFGRVVLPLGKTDRAERSPGVAIGVGEPGVAHGQL